MLYAVSWFLLLTAWWAASLTVTLPLTLLIKFNTSIRRKFFSWFLVNIAGRIYQPRSVPWRKKAFEILKANLGKRDKNVPLEVMEIGVGEGPNLKFYPENCNLTVLDQNKWFEGYYYNNSKKFSHINYKKTVICPAENMHCVPDNSMDVVVSTYLHCSCQNSDEVLQEVKRVLKPIPQLLPHGANEHLCKSISQQRRVAVIATSNLNKSASIPLVRMSAMAAHHNFQEIFQVLPFLEEEEIANDLVWSAAVNTLKYSRIQSLLPLSVEDLLLRGGKYVFLEHVKFPNGEFGLFLQRYIRPIWNLYLDGCNLDRDTASKIKRAGFSETICDNVLVKDWWMYLARHEIIGIATK